MYLLYEQNIRTCCQADCIPATNSNFVKFQQHTNYVLATNQCDILIKKLRVNFEIYIADRKATTCI